MSSSLAKMLEQLLKNRLELIVEIKDLLDKSQFGFRKGLSRLDSLPIFKTYICLAYSKRESVVCVFLDISSAYDNVFLPLRLVWKNLASLSLALVCVVYAPMTWNCLSPCSPQVSSVKKAIALGSPSQIPLCTLTSERAPAIHFDANHPTFWRPT